MTCPCLEAIKAKRWFQPLALVGASGYFLSDVVPMFGYDRLGGFLGLLGIVCLFVALFLAMEALEQFDLDEYVESYARTSESLSESTSEYQ